MGKYELCFKTAKRVDEYSSNCFSQNHLNEVCIGPCTCTDVCGGMLCSCGSNSDSFLVSCCGCESPWIAILCDIAIYAGAVFSGMRNKRQENEKRREEEATKKLSELHNELDIIKKNIEEANIKISDAEMTLNVYRMFTSFSIASVVLMMVCQIQCRNYWMIWYRSGKSTRPCVQSKRD